MVDVGMHKNITLKVMDVQNNIPIMHVCLQVIYVLG